MSKYYIPLALDIQSRPSKPRLPWIVPVVLLGVLLAPLALEGALCCYAQWCDATGTSTEVSTPIIDTIANGLHGSHEWYGDQIAPSVERLVREPKFALPFSLILIVVAIALLRR